MERDSEPTELTADELLAAARERGFNPTRIQLKDYYRAGLMRRPRQVHISGGGRGSVTKFPREALDQLTALLGREKSRRSLRETAWSMWWDHEDVETVAARKFLEEAARGLDGAIQKAQQFFDRRGNLTDEGAHELDRFVAMRFPEGPMAWMRQRVSRASSPQTARDLGKAMVRVVTSDPTPDNGSDIDVIEFAAGRDQMKTFQVNGELLWGDEYSFHPAVQLMKNFLATPLLVRTLKASDAELEAARDDAQLFLTAFMYLGNDWARLHVRWQSGLPVAGKAAEHLLKNSMTQAFATLVFACLRSDPSTRDDLETLRPLAHDWVATGPKISPVVKILREKIEDREMRLLLSPKSIRGLVDDPTRRPSHRREVAIKCREHRGEIDRLMLEHPHEFAALASTDTEFSRIIMGRK